MINIIINIKQQVVEAPGRCWPEPDSRSIPPTLSIHRGSLSQAPHLPTNNNEVTIVKSTPTLITTTKHYLSPRYEHKVMSS